MAVLPGGDRVLVLSWDGRLRMLAAADGTLLWGANAHGNGFGRRAGTLALLSAGVAVTGGSSGNAGTALWTWSVETGAARAGLFGFGSKRNGVCALATLDERRFAVGCGNGDIVFCEHADGHALALVLEVDAAESHSSSVNDISVCGARLASASDDCTAAVWDTETGARLACLFGHEKAVECVALSDSIVVTGSSFVAGSSNTQCVRIYSIAKNYSIMKKIVTVGSVHTDAVISVHVLVGSKHIMTVSRDKTIAISSIETDEVVTRLQFGFVVRCIATLPNGFLAVFGSDDVQPMPPMAIIVRPPPATARVLLKAFGVARNLDALERESTYMRERSKRLRELLPVPVLMRPGVPLASSAENTRMNCIQVLPDGDRVATVSDDGMLRISNSSNGALLWEVDAHAGAIGRRALAVIST